MPVRPSLHKIKPDIRNASVYLRSVNKWGKTTLFRDVVLEKFGDPECGLLIKCGYESGDTFLDEINSVQVRTWSELKELVTWLVNEKGKEHHIEMVCFDTVDELIPIAEKQAILIDKKDTNKEKRSVKGIMGGYNAGPRFVSEKLIKPLKAELENGGFAVWAIAHTKFKTIREKGGLEEDGYMQLTSTLDSTYESAYGDIFDVILTGVIDYDFEEKEAVVNEKRVIKKYRKDSGVRKLYFRGTPLIQGGGRWNEDAVPEYMIFESGKNNAAEFIRIFEEGMEKSKISPKKKPNPPKAENKPKEEPKPEKAESKDTSDLKDVFEKDPDFKNDDLPLDDIFDDALPFEEEDESEEVSIEDLRAKAIELYRSAEKEKKNKAREFIKKLDIKISETQDREVLTQFLQLIL